MFENGWDLPCPDIDGDDIENECDIDITLGEDCNANGIDDLCEVDTDGDDIIDDCDDDDDNDDILDVCDIDSTGGADCDNDGQDDACQINSDDDNLIDACDDDDDNDDDSDEDEVACGSDPLNAADFCPFECGEGSESYDDGFIAGFDTGNFNVYAVDQAAELDWGLCDRGASLLAGDDSEFDPDGTLYQYYLEYWYEQVAFLEANLNDSDENCFELGFYRGVIEMLLETYDEAFEDLGEIECCDGSCGDGGDEDNGCDDDCEGDDEDDDCEEGHHGHHHGHGHEHGHHGQNRECNDECDDDCDDECTEDCNDSGGRKIYICHNGRTLHVDRHALRGHLQHGDTLGTCED
jgi:hypothetical protein